MLGQKFVGIELQYRHGDVLTTKSLIRKAHRVGYLGGRRKRAGEVICVPWFRLGSFFCIVFTVGWVSAAFAQTPSQEAPTPPSLMVVASGESANIFVEVSKKVIPSVVNISSVTRVGRPEGAPLPEEFFRRLFEEFFGRGGRGAPFPFPFPDAFPSLVALGSGFIIDASGIILTNNHVIDGAAEISISFTEHPGERPAKARVIGRDPELDIALLEAQEKGRAFVPVVLGDSDRAQVGEYVLAIGNPFGQGHSVTHGIISQKGRPSPDFPLTTYIQTDAPINPGNSGGPLVNLKGEVIAVNNAVHAGAQGIGFAIPINSVKGVLPELREKGRIVRGYLGVVVRDLTSEIAEKLGVKGLEAPYVVQTSEGSPGHKAGLQPFDVIVSFNGKTIKTADELISEISSTPPGQKVPIVIKRNGKENRLQVQLGERPSRGGEPPKRQRESERRSSKLGARFENMNAELARELGVPTSTKGVVVVQVVPRGPAAEAGIQPGDIVLELNGEPVRSVKEFSSKLEKVSGEVLLRVRRPNPKGEDVYLGLIVSVGA